jgi:aspartyl-tRNA(Asn)/glutamyl-tRNA(Gln) amidotransferase subunit C
MDVDPEQVTHIAALANLEFSEEELAPFTDQLNQILRYIENLNELDTETVEPTFSSREEAGEPFRQDRVEKSIPAEDAMRNAPKQDRGQFLVPRILS